MNEIIKQNGIKYGVMLGILGVLSQLTVYSIGGISEENSILNTVIIMVFWISYLLTRIIQSVNIKKDFGGFISFKELFTSLTITITVGIIISQFFTFIFNNFIDIDYGIVMNNFMNEQQILAKKAFKNFTNVSSSDLKEIANTNNFSFVNILQGTLFSFLISSIMNILLAAIFKKNKPVF